MARGKASTPHLPVSNVVFLNQQITTNYSIYGKDVRRFVRYPKCTFFCKLHWRIEWVDLKFKFLWADIDIYEKFWTSIKQVTHNIQEIKIHFASKGVLFSNKLPIFHIISILWTKPYVYLTRPLQRLPHNWWKRCRIILLFVATYRVLPFKIRKSFWENQQVIQFS